MKIQWFALRLAILCCLLLAGCSDVFYPPPPALTPTLTPSPLPTQVMQPTATVEIPALRIWSGRTIHSLCLQVSETYNGNPSESASQFLKAIFEEARIEILNPGMDCEATLTVSVHGDQTGATYESVGGCLSGGYVSGSMELSATGLAPKSHPINYNQEPVGALMEWECVKSRDQFPEFLAQETQRELQAGLYSFWTAGILDAIEKATSIYTSEEFAALFKLDSAYDSFDPGLVDQVIEALENPDPVARQAGLKWLLAMGDQVRQAEKALPVVWDLLESSQEVDRQVQLLTIIGRYGRNNNFGMARSASPKLTRYLAGDPAQQNEVSQAAYQALRTITGQDLGPTRAAWEEKYPLPPLPHPSAPASQMAPYFWLIGILIALEALWGSWLVLASLGSLTSLYGGRLSSRAVGWMGLLHWLPCLLLLTVFIFQWEFPLWYGLVGVGLPLVVEVLIRVLVRPRQTIVPVT